MAGAVNVFAQNLDGIDVCIRAVAAVEQKEYIVGIYHIHEAVDLFLSLDNCAHVVMECKSHIHFLSNLTQFAEACGQSLPLIVVHDIFAFQDGLGLALDAVALLGSADDAGAYIVQEITLFDKLFLDFLIGLCKQEGGEPLVADDHVTKVKSFLQLIFICRIVAADFASLEACKCHLTDGLLEGVLRAKLRHIIVCPADRSDTQFY